MKRTALTAALVLALAACGGGAEEEDETAAEPSGSEGSVSYPEAGSTVQLMLGLSAGGTTDTWARLLAEEMSQRSDARVQVVNMPGAGGQLAINKVLQSPDDTSKIANVNLPSALKYLYPNSEATYSRDDFAPAGCTGYTPNVLLVRDDSPYESLQDLVEEAQSRPGELNAAADGALSDDTVAYANFEEAADVDVNVVVVDGSAEKVTALLGDQVDFFTGGLTGVKAQVDSGDFRVLAVLAQERSPFLEDVPTAIEQDVDVTSDSFFCLTFAKDAPEEARAGLEDLLREISEDPEYEQANADVGMQVRFLSGEELSEEWANQEKIVSEVIERIQ